MAKFKTNHTTRSRSGGRFIFRLIVYGMVLLTLLFLLARKIKLWYSNNEIQMGPEPSEQVNQNGLTESQDYLPSQSEQTELIKHKFFSLSYSEKHEQAEWVAYHLTVDQLNAPKQERRDYFSPDLSIKSHSSIHRDYTGSGYTRGHLAPAADMAFNAQAAEECFLMSNISPQLREFNNGIWRELEENVRDWARKNKSLYIVTGPVLNSNLEHKIGKNRVTIPELFYKIIVDPHLPEIKAIAYIIPNKMSINGLEDYSCSIDSIEKITQLDFFRNLKFAFPIDSLEANYSQVLWPINKNRYNLRIDKWNKQQ